MPADGGPPERAVVTAAQWTEQPESRFRGSESQISIANYRKFSSAPSAQSRISIANYIKNSSQSRISIANYSKNSSAPSAKSRISIANYSKNSSAVAD